MTFWTTSFWAAIATVSRLTSQFVMAKLIALFAGPAAFGLIGQFQSFASMVQLGSGGIVNAGVVKYS
ncbi:MAG: O-antigen translocase, partial [Gammaproteobacteria bacterium]|nr:O-antigen translocase [Gammaproteobacteria bacterium]